MVQSTCSILLESISQARCNQPMHTLELISPDRYQRAKWKNGLGHTDQIAIHPMNADLRKGDFLWRISTARIENASDFSLFPDHDRNLIILEGAGVRLTHTFPESNASDTIELPRLEPYEFPGDVPSRCELLQGAVNDFSVFVRKGEAFAQIEIQSIPANQEVEWAPEGQWNFIYVVEGMLMADATRVGPGETLRVEQGSESLLGLRAVDSPATFIQIQIQ